MSSFLRDFEGGEMGLGEYNILIYDYVFEGNMGVVVLYYCLSNALWRFRIWIYCVFMICISDENNFKLKNTTNLCHISRFVIQSVIVEYNVILLFFLVYQQYVNAVVNVETALASIKV
jgi:hypothetical protein